MIWLEPWSPVLEEHFPKRQEFIEFCEGWEKQLMTEVGPKHPLFGHQAKLIARLYETDDALFQLDDGRVADVHLTWSKGPEPDPRWPVTAIWPSLDDWVREELVRYHREWLENR